MYDNFSLFEEVKNYIWFDALKNLEMFQKYFIFISVNYSYLAPIISSQKNIFEKDIRITNPDDMILCFLNIIYRPYGKY